MNYIVNDNSEMRKLLLTLQTRAKSEGNGEYYSQNEFSHYSGTLQLFYDIASAVLINGYDFSINENALRVLSEIQSPLDTVHVDSDGNQYTIDCECDEDGYRPEDMFPYNEKIVDTILQQIEFAYPVIVTVSIDEENKYKFKFQGMNTASMFDRSPYDFEWKNSGNMTYNEFKEWISLNKDHLIYNAKIADEEFHYVVCYNPDPSPETHHMDIEINELLDLIELDKETFSKSNANDATSCIIKNSRTDGIYVSFNSTRLGKYMEIDFYNNCKL